MCTDKNTIKHILNEEYKSVKLDTVIKIAQAFNMTLIEFLSDDNFNIENLDKMLAGWASIFRTGHRYHRHRHFVLPCICCVL